MALDQIITLIQMRTDISTEEKLNLIMPFLDETVDEGLITLEKVRIIKYRHKAQTK